MFYLRIDLVLPEVLGKGVTSRSQQGRGFQHCLLLGVARYPFACVSPPCVSLSPPLGFGTSSGFGCSTTGASTFGFGTTNKPSGSLCAGLCVLA